MTSSWTDHGVSIVSDGWTNVKGKPLISVLAVSVSGPIFLAAHDYSDKFKTASTLQKHYLKQLSVLAHTMSSKSSLIMLLIVRQREQLLRINTRTYFGLDVWFTH